MTPFNDIKAEMIYKKALELAVFDLSKMTSDVNIATKNEVFNYYIAEAKKEYGLPEYDGLLNKKE